MRCSAHHSWQGGALRLVHGGDGCALGQRDAVLLEALARSRYRTVQIDGPAGGLDHFRFEAEAPGIRSQNELFTDALGHPGPQIRVLSAYCHFSVIYRRSPVGLPVVSQLTKLPEAEKLNRMLQQIAWKAVTGHPMSGVAQ